MNVFKGIAKIGITVVASASFAVMALTESGTVIKNQAGATYRDSANILRSTTSNLVETLVQPVAALTLINDQSKLGAPGRTVTFNHVLTNTGNNTDSFVLDIVIPASVISAATIYPDENNDGVADPGSSPIASGSVIGPLAAGESFEFVIVADIDAAATINSSDALTVTATSQAVSVDGISVANGGVGTQTNTDTVTATNLPIIEISKALSANVGASPSGPHTVTFTYTNVGLTDMDPLQTNGVILKDVLPEGMRFNGAVSWSLSGTTITASGATIGGSETTGDQDLLFTTCIAPSGLCSDNDEIQFVMDGLAADESATITFEVNIDSGLSATTLYNQGIYGFDEDNNGTVDAGELDSTNTNRVPFLITSNYAVIANNGGCDVGTDNNCDALDDTNHEIVEVASASQGARVSFTNYIWNTGNDEDIFNVTIESSTFPSGTSFFLYKSDGVTPLIDTDNDSNPDTGVIPAAGETCPSYLVTASNGVCGYKVILVATLPASAIGGPYQTVKRARSSNDTSKTNTVIDRLGEIVASTVDLTNNVRAETGLTVEDSCDAVDDNCGYGAGPEAAAVTTNTAIPGATTRFTLYVTNKSDAAESYELQYSGSNFAVNTMPADWTVVFKNAENEVITNIPVLGPDDAVVVYADVTVPVDAESATQDVYFKVFSPTTGAEDIKYDAVTVDNNNQCLAFGPPNSNGVTFAGGSIVYKHILNNNTNDEFLNIVLTVANSEAGFSTVIYEDTDSDNILTGADNAITSVASLAGGAQKILFIKVFVPANTPQGTDNITTVETTVSCGTLQIIDTTTVANTNMKVTKEQTPDLDCNGVSDSGTYVTTNFAVAPGQCIMYRLTTENIAIEEARNVTLTDATPAYTAFNVVGSLPSISKGSINTIANGSTGAIIGTIGSVSPGESEELIFSVRIDN